jgi:hypothetical protein
MQVAQLPSAHLSFARGNSQAYHRFTPVSKLVAHVCAYHTAEHLLLLRYGTNLEHPRVSAGEHVCGVHASEGGNDMGYCRLVFWM